MKYCDLISFNFTFWSVKKRRKRKKNKKEIDGSIVNND